MAEDNPRPVDRHPPPALFAVTTIPFGVMGGFCGATMPFLTRRAGIDMDAIGWFGLATMIPPMVQFLYSPIIDIGPKRKHWLIIVTALGAACMFGAVMTPLPAGQNVFLALTVAGQLLSGLVGSCNGGILAATLPNHLRGAAGGWLNFGNLGGAALGAWIALRFTAHNVPPLIMASTLAALMILPSLAALAYEESPRAKRPAAELFRTVASDVWRVARSRPGWTGILICASPVGTAALINYFAGLGKDYHASDDLVTWINGPINGLLSAAGALVGGYACDHLNRRVAYLSSGVLTAICAVVMALMPAVPTTYGVGVCVYLFISGICYASFSAMILEAIGTGGAAAATQYTLFTSAANGAIGYTGFVDTRFQKNHGVAGLLFCDAALNMAGIVFLLIVFRFVYRRVRAPEASAA